MSERFLSRFSCDYSVSHVDSSNDFLSRFIYRFHESTRIVSRLLTFLLKDYVYILRVATLSQLVQNLLVTPFIGESTLPMSSNALKRIES